VAPGTARAGMGKPRGSVDAVGSVGRAHGIYRGNDSSGYLRGELAFGSVRALAGASAGRASFAGWYAAEAGAAWAQSRRIDVAVRYRAELIGYTGSLDVVALHSLIADGRYAMSTVFDVGVSAIATVGSIQQNVALLASVAWRPWP